MSRIPTKKIDGDVTVVRHVTAGGNATIDGSVQINHNIKIKGWLDAPNVATPMKGLFSSEERLKAAYDDLREGWYALVHTGEGQAACWVVQDGKWKNTGDTVAITQGASIADFMDEVNTAIDAEAEDRYQGDADLNAKILQEVADRKTADDAESAARITADNNLSTLINTEIADRVTDVEDLSNRIEAEKSARETADANLSGRIDTEVAARETADDALDKDKEKRRKVYSFQLVDKLTTSSTHADIQKAFTTHFNDDSLIGVGGTGTSIKDVIAIPGAGDRLIDVWNKLTIYLDDQQQRAVITSVRQYETETSGVVGRIKKYDITYSDGIKSKTITLDAQNADAWKITNVVTFDAITEIEELKNVLQDFVSEEATTRANADKALSERIDTEATTRANADNDLSKRIGAEATARANVDANLSNRIEAEVSAREAADNELVSRITDEMNVRSTAIQRLDNLLSEETQARITVDDNLAGLIDDTKSYLNTRIDEEAQTRLTEDNKKKNKDFVMRIAGETITTPEGFEFSLIDTEPQTLASVILHGECDIVLSDGIRNDYRLDHVWLSDGMPYGYKLLDGNRRLNIATVTDSEGNLKVIYKFNEGAVTYDNLGGVKPLVIGLKLGDDGQPIEDIGLSNDETAAFESDVTFEQVKAAYDAKRPIYVDFSKWEDGAVMFNLVPVQQILSIGGSNAHLQGVATISNYDGGAIIVSFYAVNDGENPAKVSILLGSNPWDYNELKDKPTINGVELSGGSLLNRAEELDLCRKPMVLTFKLDESGNRIVLDEQATVKSYLVEGATYEELKQAYQLRRPLYFSIKQAYSSYSQLTAGLIPLTYRIGEIDGFEGEGFWAHGTDGLSGVEYNERTDMGVGYIGGYTIIGEPTNENGEFVMHCSEGVVTSIYETMGGLPQINGVTLIDNKTSQDLKLQGQLTTSADLTLSADNVLSLTDMAKKRLFIDLWNQAAGDYGRYNEETGFFELYEIYDIGWDEALLIYRISGQWDLYSFSYNVEGGVPGYGRDIRVLLPFVTGSNGEASFSADTRLHNETLQYLAFCRKPYPWYYLFFNVNIHGFRFPQLKKIYDTQITIQNVAENSPFVFNMPKLEYAKFYFGNSNYTTIYFRANLNYECTNYLFTNIPTQNANGQCVFKLAANMYNRLSGTATDYESSGGTKEEWMALADLATSKHITLATE